MEIKKLCECITNEHEQANVGDLFSCAECGKRFAEDKNMIIIKPKQAPNMILCQKHAFKLYNTIYRAM